ncbi:MAG: hypothetical protein, partial [Olavius algarvensis Gamma 1 endosymbiont]
KANSSRWRSMITSVTSRLSHSVPGRPTVLTASGLPRRPGSKRPRTRR